MTWVANELILESKFNFFLECMRVPPDWHLWVYFLGDEHEAEKFQVTISLFREEEYGRMGDSSAFTAQRSYTGPVSLCCLLFRDTLLLTSMHIVFQRQDKIIYVGRSLVLNLLQYIKILYTIQK